MVLTLYKCDASGPVRSVLMLIEKLNLEINFVEINLFEKEHLTEAFKKINPQHTLPTLIDDDFVLGDSHAICAYLVNKYAPDDSLYPREAKQRAVVDQRLHFDSGVLFPAVRTAFLPVLFGVEKKISNENLEIVKSAYELADKFATKKWIAGDRLTIADLCWITSISTVDGVIPIEPSEYPNLFAWLQRCSELEIYKKRNEPGKKEIVDMIKSLLA